MKILLAEVRKSKGMTLRDLASKTGLGKSTLNNFEAEVSSPNLNQLEAIAKALDCKIIDLFESENK